MAAKAQVKRTLSRSTLRHYSPLRYPGGKAKLASVVKLIFLENGLCDGVYAEPYAGGASVALSLLYDQYASRVLINDVDPAVFAFWHTVLNETEALCRLVIDTKLNPTSWRRQRAIYQNGDAVPRLELGFAAFFLNRTNRSGIISSAGMIGGKSQQGKWKLDARYNARNLVARIERVAEHRDHIAISNMDALVFIQECALRLPKKALVYLDPPYFVKGQGLYANYYDDDDHRDIASAIRGMPFRWMVSYDDEPEIRKLYRGCSSIRYGLRYSAAARETGSEVMFFSNTLKPPRRDARCPS